MNESDMTINLQL